MAGFGPTAGLWLRSNELVGWLWASNAPKLGFLTRVFGIDTTLN